MSHSPCHRGLSLLSWGIPQELPIPSSGGLKEATEPIPDPWRTVGFYRHINGPHQNRCFLMKKETNLHRAAVALVPGSETSAILAQIN